MKIFEKIETFDEIFKLIPGVPGGDFYAPHPGVPMMSKIDIILFQDRFNKHQNFTEDKNQAVIRLRQ